MVKNKKFLSLKSAYPTGFVLRDNASGPQGNLCFSEDIHRWSTSQQIPIGITIEISRV